MNFSQNLAMVMVQSTEPFPVDFDDAWKWIGYFQKSDAKKALLNSGFIEGIDFQVLRKAPQNSKGGRPAKKLYLTVDCFKSFGMMAGTEKGKQIRQYFLECEKRVKEIIPAQNAELEKLKLELELSKSELARTQCQERLLSAAQILSYNHPGLAALALGQTDAVVNVPTPPVHAIVDANGRILETYDGLPISRLAERYGFGRGKKANEQCRQWIRSMGIGDSQWVEEKGIHITKKLPREMLSVLDQNFQGGRGQRQRLVGE
ncbi:phage antirepressor protein [Leptolyngbya sp. Heron Island J]|uniref:phage antirepressor protein n=1 Tax=Leptolyngbya sp. Heron Island J TaxID=1385935 RepID=UPI0003B9CAA7|nr:phage antirepressor protein [Leptolyngbya sp. Heron Island J]ESA39131.1 phage antirepressor protein [Leptolyngbya sp. Heron Island J]